MDYPFFIKEIAELPPELISRLAEMVPDLEYTQHPHFSTNQHLASYIGPLDYSCDLGRIIIDSVIPRIALDSRTIDMREVNKIPAGGKIFEHSDIDSQDGAQGAGVVVTHKIHVPIITSPDCYYGHRRTLATPRVYRKMLTGWAYAYNNYVWHSVHNNSETVDRYQLTVRFKDPDWVLREKIIRRGNTAVEQSRYEVVTRAKK